MVKLVYTLYRIKIGRIDFESCSFSPFLGGNPLEITKTILFFYLDCEVFMKGTMNFIKLIEVLISKIIESIVLLLL